MVEDVAGVSQRCRTPFAGPARDDESRGSPADRCPKSKRRRRFVRAFSAVSQAGWARGPVPSV